MELLDWIIFGLIAGVVANMIYPEPSEGGVLLYEEYFVPGSAPTRYCPPPKPPEELAQNQEGQPQPTLSLDEKKEKKNEN